MNRTTALTKAAAAYEKAAAAYEKAAADTVQLEVAVGATVAEAEHTLPGPLVLEAKPKGRARPRELAPLGQVQLCGFHHQSSSAGAPLPWHASGFSASAPAAAADHH